MEWKLARETDDLTDDPSWEGTVLGQPDAPQEAWFFPVGTIGGALVHDNRVSIRVGWYNAAGDPVAVKGTCTAWPMSIDLLPRPPAAGQTVPGQAQRIVSVDDALIDIAAWKPWSMPVQPHGLWSVRLTAMVAAGATRAVVYYLARP